MNAASARTEPLLEAQREIRQLQEAIVALRGQLETVRHEYEERMQKLRADADAEARQLQGTIVRLREELERGVQDARDRVSRAERAHRDEADQLRDTIRALRERLEAAHTRQTGGGA